MKFGKTEPQFLDCGQMTQAYPKFDSRDFFKNFDFLLRIRRNRCVLEQNEAKTIDKDGICTLDMSQFFPTI